MPEQGHPGVSNGAKDMSVMNSFIDDIFEKLAGSAPAICRARWASPGNVQSLPRGVCCLAPGNPRPRGRYVISDTRFQPGEEASHLELHLVVTA